MHRSSRVRGLVRQVFGGILARTLSIRNRDVFILDVIALLLLPAVALWMRFDDPSAIVALFPELAMYTIAALGIKLFVSLRLGLYKRFWRSATVEELMRVVLAVGFSTFFSLLAFLGFAGSGIWRMGFPRGLPLIDGLLTLLAVGAIRFSPRFAEVVLRPPPGEGFERVLIAGAGLAGQAIARELNINPELKMLPYAFLDDDDHKQHVRILNLPVLGKLDALPSVVKRHGIDRVIIAMPRAEGKVIRAVYAACKEVRVPAKTMPGMYEIVGGRVSVNQLRNVQIEDLLRREPVQTDIAAVRELVRGKRVLVTGGGGSIGGELCRQVMRCDPSELAILGHGENSVFGIHNEMLRVARLARSSEAPIVHAFIGDIRFPERLRGIMQQFRPDIIFHAAAHKHVPLMELNPVEAVMNNMIGTRNLLEAARACEVPRFVMISTDKAVNPTSIMGASKRVAEMLVLKAARETGLPYVTVRFGNVLGSRGSVVLTFKEQIAAGGPITVSHEDMTRYFMTIPEAVQLVLQASVLGKSGEIFVLDMGEPIRIMDLARDMIRLSGLEVDRDIEIAITGIRPGEKLYEELFNVGEEYDTTHHEKIRTARNAASFVPENLVTGLSKLEAAARAGDHPAIRHALQELLPEYQPDLLPPPSAVPAGPRETQISRPDREPSVSGSR